MVWKGEVMSDSLCRCQVLVSLYCARRIPAHVKCTQCSILFLTVYLLMADIANPDLFVSCCRTWICLNITTFMRSSASHPAGPHGRLSTKSVNRAPIAGGGRFRHNLHCGLLKSL